MRQKRDISYPAPHSCTTDVHLPKDDEIITGRARTHTCERAGAPPRTSNRDPWARAPCTHRAQASLLQFTSITGFNPISHSIDPQNCCSPEPAANNWHFSPSFHHHCSLLHKEAASPPPAPNTPPPLHTHTIPPRPRHHPPPFLS